MFALSGELQTPGKTICEVKTPKNTKYNPLKIIIFVVIICLTA